MTRREKNINLLKTFLDTYSIEGVCGYIVDPDGSSGEENDDEFYTSVIIVFDLDWLQSMPTKTDFITRRYRNGMKEEIHNFTGLNVYVGSTARKCEKDNILESLSPKIRRRLSYHSLKSDLDYSVIDEMDPCQFATAGEFIAEACDMLKDVIIDYFEDIKVSPKENDQLYYYLVNEFSDYLLEIYFRRCPNRRKGVYTMNESTKTDNVRKVLYKVLDSMSEEWKVKKYAFDEITVLDSEGSEIFDYETMRFDVNSLTIDPLLLQTVIGYATVDGVEPNRYDIQRWFNQKYGKDAKTTFLKGVF